MRTFAVAAVVVTACTTPTQPAIDPVPGSRTALVEVEVFTNVADTSGVIGAEVAFVDPNGAAQVLRTDAKGHAIATMAPGGSVTAIVGLVPRGNPPALSTVLDVQDGDVIRLGTPGIDLGAPAAGTPTCASDTLVATYTGADALGLSGLYLQRSAGDDVKDGTPITPIGASTSITVSGAPSSAAVIHTDLAGPAPGNQQWIGEVIDGCATSYQLDLADAALPWVDAPRLSADASTLHVPMTGGSGGDLLYQRIGYTADRDVVNWTIAGPIMSDTMLPPLPDDMAPYAPPPGTSLHSAAAWVLDYGRGGYAHARGDAMALGLAGDDMMVPATGRARGSYRIVLD